LFKSLGIVNIDLKTVQSRLGHVNFNLTLNTYAHLIDANDKAATKTFSGLLKRSEKSEGALP
jgi:integrase